jgi:hypothetical protein
MVRIYRYHGNLQGWDHAQKYDPLINAPGTLLFHALHFIQSLRVLKIEMEFTVKAMV